jgi:hypothetical protein
MEERKLDMKEQKEKLKVKNKRKGKVFLHP